MTKKRTWIASDPSLHRNRNETDWDAYRQWCEERDALAAERARERRKNNAERIQRNLATHDSNVPARFKGVSLRAMSASGDPTAKAVTKKLVQTGNRSLYLYQGGALTREKIVYGLVRDYIEMGWCSPDEVVFFTDQELSVMATVGFEGYNNFRNRLYGNGPVKMVVIQGIHHKDTRTRKEMRLTEELIDKCFREDAALVMGSGMQLGEYLDTLGPDSKDFAREIFGKNAVKGK